MMRTPKRSYGVSCPTKLVACFLLISLLCVAVPSTLVVLQAETAIVGGRVIDEAGEGLADVTIEVYSQDGAFVVSTQTYSGGYFAIYSLYPGFKYTIYFSKPGYVTVTKTVLLNVQWFNLQNIVLRRALRLSSSVLSRVASPGDILALPFTVSNIGEELEDVEFSVSKPENWSTRILDQTSEVTKIRLSAGASLNLQLEATIPLTSTGNNSLSLTAAGKTTSTLNFTIAVKPSDKPLISCQFPGTSASPGDTVQFQVRVKNPFSDKLRFLVAIESVPPNWTAVVKSAGGAAMKEVILESGGFIDLVIEVYVPLGEAEGKYTLIFRASSPVASEDLTLSVVVEPSDKPMLSCQFPGLSANPGDTIRFQVRVKNPFSVKLRFRVIVDSIPLNWTTCVKTVGSQALTEVTLDSGEFVDLLIEVTPPATSDGKVAAFLPLNITLTEAVEEEEEEITVAATFLEVTVEAGKVVKYPITIINSGETNRSLLLSTVEYPKDWKVAFKSGETMVSGLYLEAGKSENLVVEVTPPSTANIGSYAIVVQVESRDGVVRTRLELKATIIGSYALSLESSTLLTSATVGGSTTFTARITNTGQTSVTGLRLNVDTPQGWETSIAPTQVESLKPREYSTFTIVVKTPDDTVAGDYLLTLKGLSDQVESDKVQIRVTATAPTSWGLIGIGVATVMVVALIVVFKKFRRR